MYYPELFVQLLTYFDTGVDGVAHVATDVSFNPNPNQVVPPVVRGVRNALEAANESGSVKRFVYTSSSIAAVHPTPDTKFHVDSSSWNEIDLRDAWAPPPYEASRAFPVYGASKVEGERAAWDFMKTENPEFILNTVLPNLNVGPRLNPKQGGSTSGWVQGLFEGDEQFTQMMLQFPPQYHVDVRDTAAIHVAALLEDDVKGERLFAFAEPYNYSMIVDILKKIDPSRSFPAAPENEGVDLSTVDTARAEELLKRMGRDHFISFEQSLQEQLKL